jgi:hypothetical protein
MKKPRKHSRIPASPLEHERRVKAAAWVAEHRGVLTQIAAAQGVSVQFVHLVLRGKRKSVDGSIERAIRKAGGPI